MVEQKLQGTNEQNKNADPNCNTTKTGRETIQRQKTSIKGSNYEEEEPLLYHSTPIPGKFTIKSTKPMNNVKDLSLAYSPGVAVPCIAIA